MIKRKRKYKLRKRNNRLKKYRGRGIFGDGFKFLYSIGKQWRKSMRWKGKKLRNDETSYP